MRDARTSRASRPPAAARRRGRSASRIPISASISVAMRRGGQTSIRSPTLRHELAHLALGAALGDRAPHWLHEGFAYQHSGEWSWERTETLAGMAWFGGIIPLDELDAVVPRRGAAGEPRVRRELRLRRLPVAARALGGHRRRRRSLAVPPVPVATSATARTLDTAASARVRQADPRAVRRVAATGSRQRYLLAPVGLLGLGVWVLCALLLAFAWWKKRRSNKKRMAEWDRDEVVAPPYVPWPGDDDPLADPDDDKPRDPQLMN